MADKYWVGATNAWTNATSSWSYTDGGPGGAPIPTSVDNIYFTRPGGYNVAFQSGAGYINCYNMYVSPDSSPFFTSVSSFNWYGDTVQLSPGCYFSGASGTIRFRPAAGTTMTISGSTSAVKFNHDINCYGPGTVVFASDLGHATKQSGGYQLLLNTDVVINEGVTIAVGGCSTTATTVPRTMTCDGVISLSVPQLTGGVTTVFSSFSIPNAANLTWQGIGHLYVFYPQNAGLSFGGTGPTTASVSGAPNVVVPAFTYAGNVSLTGYFGTVTLLGNAYVPMSAAKSWRCQNFYIGGGNLSNVNITFVGESSLGAGASYTFDAANAVTFSGIQMLHNENTAGTVYLTGDGAVNLTTFLYIRGGTLALNGKDLSVPYIWLYRYSDATGFVYSTRGIDFGDNTITLTNSTSGYTVINAADISGAYFTGNGGLVIPNMNVSKVLTVGTTGREIGYLPNLFLTTGNVGASSITTGGYFNTLSYGSCGFTPAASTQTVANLVLGNGTYTNLNVVTTYNYGGGAGTITTNGKAIASLTVDNPGGTTTLVGDVTTPTTTLNQGTLNLDGYTISTPTFISNSSANRSITNGAISVSGNWTVSDGSNFTGSNYTINMTNASAKTFAGAGGQYGTLNQAGSGALTITGSNTFTDITTSVLPTTINYGAGSTQTVNNFTLAGSAGSPVTIQSTVAGTQFTLSKTSGTVAPNYLNIQDSNAIGGATWDALSTGTNTNLGNNTGWRFVLATSPVTGQFMAFF
jgi:hypothetical protein